MRSKVILVSIILAGALTLTACGDAGQKESREKPKSTESTANAESNKEDGNEQKPFTGVSWNEADDEKYATYKGDLIMCVDYDNGGIYYVNWRGDKYLYYWKDGKNKLILDKWVSQIAYMDGKVYCIYDKSGKTYNPDISPSYEGVIAEVDVKTGKYTELTDRTAHLLTVAKDGIYYEWITGPDAEEQKQESGFYSFQDSKIHEIEEWQDREVSQTRFGKYAVVSKVEGEDIEYYVMDLETKEKMGMIETVDGESIGLIYRLEEKLFFNSSAERNSGVWTWWSLDMTTGEKKQVKAENPAEKVHTFVRLGDLLYTVCNGNGEYGIYDEEKEEFKIFRITDINGNFYRYDMSNFKTDSKYLYTVDHNNNMMVLEVREDGVYEIGSPFMEENGKKK